MQHRLTACILTCAAVTLTGCVSYDPSLGSDLGEQELHMFHDVIKFQFGDLEVSGTLSPDFPVGYMVDIRIGGVPLKGKMGHGIWGEKVELQLGGEPVVGTIMPPLTPFTNGEINVRFGESLLSGTVRPKGFADTYELSYDGMAITGQVEFGMNYESYEFMIGDASLSGRKTFEMVAAKYALDTPIRDTEQVAVFLVLEFDRIISHHRKRQRDQNTDHSQKFGGNPVLSTID